MTNSGAFCWAAPLPDGSYDSKGLSALPSRRRQVDGRPGCAKVSPPRTSFRPPPRGAAMSSGLGGLTVFADPGGELQRVQQTLRANLSANSCRLAPRTVRSAATGPCTAERCAAPLTPPLATALSSTSPTRSVGGSPPVQTGDSALELARVRSALHAHLDSRSSSLERVQHREQAQCEFGQHPAAPQRLALQRDRSAPSNAPQGSLDTNCTMDPCSHAAHGSKPDPTVQLQPRFASAAEVCCLSARHTAEHRSLLSPEEHRRSNTEKRHSGPARRESPGASPGLARGGCNGPCVEDTTLLRGSNREVLSPSCQNSSQGLPDRGAGSSRNVDSEPCLGDLHLSRCSSKASRTTDTDRSGCFSSDSLQLDTLDTPSPSTRLSCGNTSSAEAVRLTSSTPSELTGGTRTPSLVPGLPPKLELNWPQDSASRSVARGFMSRHSVSAWEVTAGAPVGTLAWASAPSTPGGSGSSLPIAEACSSATDVGWDAHRGDTPATTLGVARDSAAEPRALVAAKMDVQSDICISGTHNEERLDRRWRPAAMAVSMALKEVRRRLIEETAPR